MNNKLYVGDFIYRINIPFQKDCIILITNIDKEYEHGTNITGINLTDFTKYSSTFIFKYEIEKNKITDPKEIEYWTLVYKINLLRNS